ncbi:expressed unknown protein [Seminavis robusta]|uniref:SET domain-containing protein n=1 Tax=Seminavis robusta TaxID=568900 RepID=A0A9N8ENL8_9STRA|nr:expressed unknown protein [Seminavis robusta]|eukprot:Sro1636_g287560.1 n/a (231) ;mRNA; r:6326-7018
MSEAGTADSQHPDALPIPDESTWEMLVDAYKKAKKESDKRDVALLERLTSSNRSGFHVDFEIRHIPGKGRGLFAAQDIPKGTCVSDDRTGRFRTEQEWRDFLALLPHDLAKESVDWVGVDDYRSGEAVYIDLSESSLLNHGFSRRSLQWWERCFPCCTWRKVTATVEGKYFDGMWHMVATRDLEAGEELLCDYNQCGNYNHNLPWYDVICQEYYPGITRYDELERWCRKK